MKREYVKEVNHPFPNINKKEPHIYVAAHSFTEDTMASVLAIEQNVYILFGTTDQLNNNPQVYAAWANGFIYIDRKSTEARKLAIKKMERILKNGSSILMFVEGVLNNTENLLCNEIYASPYTLVNSDKDIFESAEINDLTIAYEVSNKTGYTVVPLAPFHDLGSNKIHVKFSQKPLDLKSKYKKALSNEEETIKFIKEERRKKLDELRNELATLTYYNIEEYTQPVQRELVYEELMKAIMNLRKIRYRKPSDKIKLTTQKILAKAKNQMPLHRERAYINFLKTKNIHELYMEYRRLEYNTTL